MTKQNRILALLLLLCVLLALAACGKAAEPEASPAGATGTQAPEGENAADASSEEEDFGATTLMFYMVGSDLEQHQRAATADLVEISKSGVDLTRTNILICAGGSGRWWNDLADPEAITILRLTESGYQVEDTLPLRSMGDPECLSSFVTLCTERWSADHYALIFWDHGNGPVIGYGKDMLFERDSLTLQEMRQAMADTPFAGDLKLDLVGFDACLMASAELGCVWQNYADLLVASQETEPGFGWNYAFLSQCGRCSSRELACLAADAFMDYALEAFSKRDDYYTELTLSVLDLSKAGALEDAVNQLFHAAASRVSGDYIRLAQARVGIRAMGRASTGSEYDLVDLLTVVDNMAADYPNESAAVRQAAEDMVIYSVSNTSQCTGMSLYYPYYNKQYYQKSWKEIYRELAVFPEYLSYLERYETIWLGTDMQQYFSQALTLEEGGAPSTYTLQLTDEQARVFADANYFIVSRFGEGLYSLTYCSDDVSLEGNRLTATFDGRIFYYESDFGEKGIPYTRMWGTVDGVTDYSAMGILLTRGDLFGDGQDDLAAEVRFSVDTESGDMLLKGFYSTEDEEEFSGGKQDAIDLSEWDMIQFFNIRPRYLIRDEQGRIPYFWDWPESGVISWHEISMLDNPHFSFEPLYDDGREYFILINVMDVQGNRYSSELFPIQLAPAPPEETAPTDTVVWPGGEEVTLLDVQNVTVKLHTAASLDTGEPFFYLETENRNAFPVVVELGGQGTLLNSRIDCGSNHLAWVSAEANSTQFYSMQNLSRYALLSSQGRLEELLCSGKIFRMDNSATLYQGRLCLQVSAPLSFSVGWDPVLGALAERQRLLEADGFQVSLLNLGAPTDSGSNGPSEQLCLSLALENRSPDARDVNLDGFLINGWFLSVSQEMHMEGGQCWYPIFDYRPTTIRKLNYAGFYDLEEDASLLPSLQEISSLALCLTVDGRLYLCPVELAVHGSEDPVAAEGELLYEDDALQLWLHRSCRLPYEEEKEASVWYLWVVNKGEGLRYLYCRSSKPFPESKTPGWIGVCPGGVCFSAVADLSDDGEPLVIDFADGETYQSQRITLPAP